MTIRTFISKEKILLLILFVMLLNPFYYGYRIAVLFFLFIFFQSEKFIPILDKNVSYLLLFGATYELLAAMRIDAINETIFSFLPNIFIPALLYLVGKRFTLKYSSSDIRIFFLFFISLSFSLIPLFSILKQVIENGFTVGIRSMHLIWDKSYLISATGLGSYFSINMGMVALINVKKKSLLQKHINLGILVLFILSLICVFRLGSRTQLAIALFSFILSYLFNFSKQSFFQNIVLLCLLGTAIYYSYYLFSINSELITFYKERLNDTDVGINSAGGRTVRWAQSFQAIFTDPGGWELSRLGYAHNLWLDVARVSGVAALIPLVFFSMSSIKIFFKSLTILRGASFLRTLVLCVFLSIILVFNVEPVMDGMYLSFLLFCLFIGYLSGIVKRKSIAK